ncbi:MAG TPA: chromosome segregation protein SMC, partial [Chondromyces sp.]|nr:chromosome segregation protein SMC [Chondromyces sp.]
MFLKRLDVVGFKSFAERISIDFVEGVTAVVGPNGSGKSNVTDAIRWVLGEQSAKSLRGTKMEDIIFAGSDSRKPLNFAEVTLTLDNEDQVLPIEYNEINVTRRVYRSGDSEFFINKQPCRLKDIVDLFMDSGLGREAFSIIGQGKVEEILNSKPEERRAIFEEAAGVLKYKTRKKKAEQKLVETQENLNRVHDILHELENQVEPLQIQASIAKDFLEKKEELETFEVACIVYEIEQLHEQWEQLKKNHAEHQEQELALAAEVQTKEANLTQKRDHLAALDESISDLQNVLLSASEELEKLEGRKEVLKERKKNASQNRGQLEENIKEMEYKLQELNVQIDNLHKQTEQSRKEAEQLKSDLQSKQSIMKSLSDNLEEKIESLKSDYIDKLNLQASSKNELNYLDQQMQQLKMKNDRLVQGNEKHIAERNTLERERKAVEQAFEQSQSKLAEHVSNYRRARSELEALKAKYAKQESNLYQAYQILQQAKSRKEMLEALEEDFAGFFQGVKEVLKARGEKLSGIEGAVAELITVPKMYEAAIETALG